MIYFRVTNYDSISSEFITNNYLFRYADIQVRKLLLDTYYIPSTIELFHLYYLILCLQQLCQVIIYLVICTKFCSNHYRNMSVSLYLPLSHPHPNFCVSSILSEYPLRILTPVLACLLHHSQDHCPVLRTVFRSCLLEFFINLISQL